MKLFGAVVVAMALVLPFALTRSVPPVPHLAPSLALTERFRAISLRMPFAFALTWNHHSWLGTLGPSLGSYRTNSSYRAKLEEKLFSDRHLRHGEDSKEVLLGQEEERAWQLWKEKVKHFKKRRQQGAAPISKKKIIHHSKCEGNIHGSKLCFWLFWTQCKKKAISMFTKKMMFFRKSVLRKKTRILRKKKWVSQ